MPFFSIIITCYNQEKYITDAIASIKCQNFDSFECIIVDDGSCDNSSAKIQSSICKDQRFRLLPISHSGQASARNAGIKAANGEYILFLDGDDAYISNCLSECYACIHESEDLIIFGIQNTYYNEDNAIVRTESAIPQSVSFSSGRELASWYAVNHAILLYSSSNKAYKLKCLKSNGLLFDENLSFGEDRVFNYDFLRYAGLIETIQKCFLNYRHIDSKSLSSCFISHYIDTALFLHREKMKRLLPLIDAADETVITDFIKYDFEKESHNAEQMIENNKSRLSKAEYEEETEYLQKTIRQWTLLQLNGDYYTSESIYE